MTGARPTSSARSSPSPRRSRRGRPSRRPSGCGRPSSGASASAACTGSSRPLERREVMDAFKRGELDVLVATTVIEVGVDVPNATIMIVQEADRFGLAQLHQLRGRVGRGGEQSYCLLVSRPKEELTEDAARRLEALVETSDGFELAEVDLELRGRGPAARRAPVGALRPEVRAARARPGARSRRPKRGPSSSWTRIRRSSSRSAGRREPPMRIIAGSRKGARIFAPRGLDTRPTGDRVREAVFNLVGPVDGRGGARPLRRLRRDGPRGALPRRAARHLRRVRPRGRRDDRSGTSTSSSSRAPSSCARMRAAGLRPTQLEAGVTISC